jgi:hypothetical protein
MNRNDVFLSLALALAATLAAGLGLSSCAAPGQRAGETGSGTASATAAAPTQQESEPAASAEPSATAATPAPAVTATSPATPTAGAEASVKTFTFPDGHLSFSYPSDWSIRVVGSPEDAAKLRGVQAQPAGVDYQQHQWQQCVRPGGPDRPGHRSGPGAERCGRRTVGLRVRV